MGWNDKQRQLMQVEAAKAALNQAHSFLAQANGVRMVQKVAMKRIAATSKKYREERKKWEAMS